MSANRSSVRADHSNINMGRQLAAVGLISLAGFLLRMTGIQYVGVDYEKSVLTWYNQLKELGSISALADFDGLYTVFYFEILYFLTRIPVPPIVGVKLVSIFFDYMTVYAIAALTYHAAPEGKKWNYSIWVYGLLLCCPITVINSGYLGQCESLWAGLGMLAFYLLVREHPVLGMICFGFAFASKPQGVFLLPIILVYWYYKRNFSGFHFLWIPVGVQLSCIPAFIGGASWDVFLRYFKMMMGQYPFVYYFYPNFWTFLKESPYYVFKNVAIFSAVAVLAVFAVLFVYQKYHSVYDCLEGTAFTAMTCVMVLPSMHERYNYLAEICYLACAVFKPKYRVPAVLLMLCSVQINGQAYLGFPWVSHELLAVVNIVLYFYFAFSYLRPMWDSLTAKEEKA